jgi:hypothetical protein
MKALLKTAATNCISIKEACMQHNRLFGKAVQSAPPASAPVPPPSDSITSQIAALQAELKLVKETIIPSMRADLAET